MADIDVSAVAYCKLILHAAKYPHRAINGVLLAEKSKNNKTIHFVDSVPLFHLNLSLVPMLEVALSQIDAYCKSRGLVIGGYYQANEHLNNASPSGITFKIADRIQDFYSDTCVFMIDNQRMNSECVEEVYRIHQKGDGSQWKLRDTKVTVEEGTLPTASILLKSRSFRELVDFENHLDDITLDWTNPAISTLVEHST